jgi:hypothetical protein
MSPLDFLGSADHSNFSLLGFMAAEEEVHPIKISASLRSMG